MNCPNCNSLMNKNGFDPKAKVRTQKYLCPVCKTGKQVRVDEHEQPTSGPTGLSEQDLRGKYDLNFILTNKLKELKPGVFVPEQDFIKFCEIRVQGGYRSILESSAYAQYRGRAGGVTYWSAPESITRMKREGILS